MDIMFQLGHVQFTVPKLPIVAARRTQQYRYATHQPIKRAPRYEFLSVGSHRFTLSGVVFQELYNRIDAESLGLGSSQIANRIQNIQALKNSVGLLGNRLQSRANAALENSNVNPLSEIERMAASGKPYNLVDGSGVSYGQVIILGIQRNGERFTKRGGLLKQTFELDLVFTEENAR